MRATKESVAISSFSMLCEIAPVVLLSLDDIQFMAGKERTQIEIFQTLRILLSNKVRIAVASSRSLDDIQPLWRLLRSRLGTGLIVPLEMCNEKELYSILSKKFSLTKPPIPNELLKLICQGPGIDFRKAEGCMIGLGALYSASGKYPSGTQWARWLGRIRRSENSYLHPNTQPITSTKPS